MEGVSSFNLRETLEISLLIWSLSFLPRQCLWTHPYVFSVRVLPHERVAIGLEPEASLVVWCLCRSFIYITAQLETPREGYDEHSSKSSLSCETKVYQTSRRKNQTSEG
jgi:hypothetical protein